MIVLKLLLRLVILHLQDPGLLGGILTPHQAPLLLQKLELNFYKLLDYLLVVQVLYLLDLYPVLPLREALLLPFMRGPEFLKDFLHALLVEDHLVLLASDELVHIG